MLADRRNVIPRFTDADAARIEEALYSLNTKSKDEGAERSFDIAINYLIKYGMPDQPALVVALTQTAFRAGQAWAVAEGYLAPTEKGRSSEEEEAQLRRAVADARKVESDLARLFAGDGEEAPDLSFLNGSYL